MNQSAGSANHDGDSMKPDRGSKNHGRDSKNHDRNPKTKDGDPKRNDRDSKTRDRHPSDHGDSHDHLEGSSRIARVSRSSQARSSRAHCQTRTQSTFMSQPVPEPRTMNCDMLSSENWVCPVPESIVASAWLPS